MTILGNEVVALSPSLSGFGVATILRAEENKEEWVRKVIGLGFDGLLGREKKGCLVYLVWVRNHFRIWDSLLQ